MSRQPFPIILRMQEIKIWKHLSICRGKSRLASIFNRCEVGVGVRGPTEEEVVDEAAVNTRSLHPPTRYRDPHSVQVRAIPNIKYTIPNIKYA